jgi:hypothetical protein
MLFAPGSFEHGPHDDPQVLHLIGLLMTGIASMVILTGWTVSFCIFLAGRYLRQYRHYTFCLVVAGILCILVPFGTALGIFTIIVLVRPSVKTLFDQQTVDRCDTSLPAS